MITNWIILIVLFILCCMLYSMYVGLIKKKNKVKEAYSSIDVQLRKRYDLIPNILKIARKFMEHEQDLFDNITRLRTQAETIPADADNIKDRFVLDKEISAKMGQLFVNVENYPVLKSDQTMLNAMNTYSEVEEHISAARRFYNSSVNELNSAVEIFPTSVIASMLGITAYPFFETDEVSRQPIDANTYLN